MRISAVLSSVMAVAIAFLSSQASGETVQTAGDVFNGHSFLWVEGESFSSLTGPAETGWKVVTKGGPDVSVGSMLPILPNDSNVSGSAIWSQAQDTAHTHTALYDLKFITPGTYQFYLRQTQYDSNGDGTFLNEDSIFLPPAFNKNLSTDWVGFEGLEFDENDVTVDIPNPGYALDPDGYKASTGNHQNDGLLELANWGIKSEGVVEFHNASGTLSANGHFNWYNRPTYQGTLADGGFDGFFGFKTEFTVTEEMVGETVTFEVGTREVNYVIDGFMFIQVDNPYPDMDLLDIYSQADLDEGILPQALDGDYNGDGSVDAADYTAWRDNVGAAAGTLPNDVDGGVIGAAQYDTWVANFGNPGSASSAAIPEPSTVGLLLVGLGLLAARLRR